MGKITVFTGCNSEGEKAKDLLKQKGASFEEVSITAKPEWRHYMYLLANGEHVTVISEPVRVSIFIVLSMNSRWLGKIPLCCVCNWPVSHPIDHVCFIWKNISLCMCSGSLVPSPLHARARKGLVKRVALPCPRGTYILWPSQVAEP